VKLASYIHTFGSTVVIKMYVTFQDIRMGLTFVFCCLYCNEILTVTGNTHRDSGLPTNIALIWWIFDRASWYRIEILQPTWCTIFFIQQLYHIMFLYMFRASQRSSSGGHCIYAVSGFLMLCMLPYVAQTKSGLLCSPLCATYGSIQSVRKPDTAYIQCPPEDERCDARNM
jgi:hypothetical protein